MSQARMFKPDFRQFNGSSRRRNPVTFADKFPVAARRLESPTVRIDWSDLTTNRTDQGLSPHFFQYRKTDKIEGDEFLRSFELWHVQAVIANLNSREFNSETKRHLKKRLDEDCVGTSDPPHDDSRCWKIHQGTQVVNSTSSPAPASATPLSPPLTRSASLTPASAPAPAPAPEITSTASVVNATQYMRTNFLESLQDCQETIYIEMRITIVERLDKTAKDSLVTYLTRSQKEIIENDNTVTEANIFSYDKRIKWQNIKNFIIDKICKDPLPGDKFIELRKVKRSDATTALTWAHDVNDIKSSIDKEDNHWQAIVPREAMATITRWLTQDEKKLLENLILRKNEQVTFPTFADFAKTIPVDTFIAYCEDLDPEKVPKNFKQSKAKAALNATLITIGESNQRVTKALKEVSEDNQRLKKALNEANAKVVHLNKSIRINNGKLK